MLLLTTLRHHAPLPDIIVVFNATLIDSKHQNLKQEFRKKKEKREKKPNLPDFSPQFLQDPNKISAKVAGSEDKLTNHSQLLAVFGGWRVLIFYPGKNQLCNR